MRWIFIFFLLFSCSSFAQQKNLLPFVNPFVGTGGHAHTFPGACYPFGMMQLSPDTRLTGWDGCSGYHYSDSVIYGFTHTHLSGTGCSDYGDILLMPLPGISNLELGSGSIHRQNRDSSLFSHQTEKASPGYYSVVLKNGNIKVELMVAERAGMHRYIYPKTEAQNIHSPTIILDLQHRDEVTSSELKWVSDTEVCGYRESKAWARDQWVYFDIRFSRSIIDKAIFLNNTQTSEQQGLLGKNIKAVFHFRDSDTILVKIGISAVSIENAKENLVHDIPNWDFDGTLKKTQKAWNDYLNKIEVSSKNTDLLTTFYSALYHTAIHPSLYTDVNGQYRGRDMKTHTAQGYSVYTVFSIWDTYRAIHPLYTIIDSSMDRQFIQTFLRQYEQGGALPVWELSANETNCMIGYHSVSVIADAYLKGITGFDANEALKAMEHSAESEERGIPALREYGYIPANKGSESVSQTLELGYDDWCIAQMAKSLSNMDDYAAYIKLAQVYKNIYNPNNGFMQGRMNGTFVKPFNPRAVTFDYTEANAWQYSFYAPQDMSGLIALHGGKEKLAQMLDTLFSTTSIMTGREQPDITGMIGQYAQGNEPSHHIAYLYNYVGQPWKTAKYVRQLEKFYTPKPDGICGNDDCGELSAWYVMSAIGMYQVCPGDQQFELTTPLFDTVRIHLESGKTFSIISHSNEKDAQYISSGKLNGNEYSNSFLKYSDLMKGGKLDYILDDTISKWGTGNNVPIDSIPAGKSFIPQPYFEYSNAIFTDSLKVTLKGFSPKDSLYVAYQVIDSNGSSSLQAKPYTKPFYITQSGNYGYYLPQQKMANTTGHEQWGWEYLSITTQFTKIPKGRKIKIVSKPNSQYTAGGPQALIDYQHGGSDFRLGQWQGYQSQDFEAVVDLGKEETISEVNAEFLQDTRSWILMPKYIDFSVSDDSTHFTPIAHVENTFPDTAFDPTIETLGKKITPQKTRYVKVFVKNYGKLPAWHPGYGDDAFIFIDEIEIK